MRVLEPFTTKDYLARVAWASSPTALVAAVDASAEYQLLRKRVEDGAVPLPAVLEECKALVALKPSKDMRPYWDVAVLAGMLSMTHVRSAAGDSFLEQVSKDDRPALRVLRLCAAALLHKQRRKLIVVTGHLDETDVCYMQAEFVESHYNPAEPQPTFRDPVVEVLYG